MKSLSLKAVLTFIVLVTSCMVTMAQVKTPHLQLKPTGFVGSDTTKNYEVIEMPKISKADLYKKTLTYLNSIYKDPARVLTTVDGESIIINGYTEAIKDDVGLYKYPMEYIINLQFKDGKIRAEPGIKSLMASATTGKYERKYYVSNLDSKIKGETSCIYVIRSTGEVILLNPELKDKIDGFVNVFVQKLIIRVGSDW